MPGAKRHSPDLSVGTRPYAHPLSSREPVLGEHPFRVVARGEGGVVHERAVAGAQEVFDLDGCDDAATVQLTVLAIPGSLDEFPRGDVEIGAAWLGGRLVHP